MGTVLIVLVAMMLAYALLPDEREMASIVAVTPRKVAVQSASRAPLIVVNEGKADALERAREGAVPSAPEQADVRTQVPANWEHAVVAALGRAGRNLRRGIGADRLRIFCRFRRRWPDRRGRHAGRCIGCKRRF